MRVLGLDGRPIDGAAVLPARIRGRWLPDEPAEPLAETKVFPPMVVQMISVGEATGALDTMLGKIADFYDEEVDAAVGALTSLIEPLLMVVLGGAVGGLVVAMYLPIFTIANTLQ